MLGLAQELGEDLGHRLDPPHQTDALPRHQRAVLDVALDPVRRLIRALLSHVIRFIASLFDVEAGPSGMVGPLIAIGVTIVAALVVLRLSRRMLAALGPRGLLVLTWDEDDYGAGNHILTVFAGLPVRGLSTSTRRITHYTLLRTLCDGLRIPPFGGAVAETPITGVWHPERKPPAKPARTGP